MVGPARPVRKVDVSTQVGILRGTTIRLTTRRLLYVQLTARARVPALTAICVAGLLHIFASWAHVIRWPGRPFKFFSG